MYPDLTWKKYFPPGNGGGGDGGGGGGGGGTGPTAQRCAIIG